MHSRVVVCGNARVVVADLAWWLCCVGAGRVGGAVWRWLCAWQWRSFEEVDDCEEGSGWCAAWLLCSGALLVFLRSGLML